MTRRYALRDDQWERIKDLLPGRAFPLLSHCRRTIGCGWNRKQYHPSGGELSGVRFIWLLLLSG
jgi:hypothetical protein